MLLHLLDINCLRLLFDRFLEFHDFEEISEIMLGLNNVWQCYMRVCRPCVRRCDAANKWLNKLQFPELLAEARHVRAKL